MNHQNQDDVIIATVFKRSLWFVLVVGLVFGAVWFMVSRTDNAEPNAVTAERIQPQLIEPQQQVAPPSVMFADVTAAAGIRHTHKSYANGDRFLPETMGGGVAVLDFNQDGFEDLLFVSGAPWPWDTVNLANATVANSSLILYQGDGAGAFVDVTQQSGLQTSLYGMGAAVGDYDGDGFVDIFVTAVGANRLYKNQQGKSFKDVTVDTGVAGGSEAWSSGAGFLDYDRDGDLDLMVLNYVEWSKDIDLQANYQLTGIGRAYGPPSQFAGTNSYFYRNDGNGRFSDISAQVGIDVRNESTGKPVGKGLALLPTDIDGDGWIDVVVANDTVRNFAFRNQQGQGFEEVGVELGLAFDNSGAATGAMGIDSGELQSTESHAIAIGNFGNEMTSLYVRSGNESVFTDQAVVTGVGPVSRRAVTFGLLFFDYDLDGRMDLMQVNGHIEPQINIVEPSQKYAQAPQLFWNCGLECSRQLMPVDLAEDNDLSGAMVGRAAATLDIDQDGDLDLVLTQIDGPPKLLRNDQNTQHNWLRFELKESTGAPAYGAQVEIASLARRQRLRVEPTRSYLSQVSSSLTFGLGPSDQVNTATVFWADGTSTVIEQPTVKETHRVIQHGEAN